MGRQARNKSNIKNGLRSTENQTSPNHISEKNTSFSAQQYSYTSIKYLPDPEEMARYNEVVPGMPEALLDAYLKQGEHRRSLERQVIQNDIVKQYIGQIAGAVIAFVTIWRSTQAILQGYEIGGVIGVLTALSSVVSVFVFGKRQQVKELEEKK